MKKTVRNWLCIVLATMLLLVLPPNTQAAGDPMVSGSIIRDFARITFYWQNKVQFNASVDGTRLVISFDRQVNPDFSSILSALHPYVVRAELMTGRKSVAFTLDKPYKIRTFITETETGVDILKVLGEGEPSPVPTLKTAAKTEPKAEPKPAAKPQPKPEAKPQPQTKPDTSKPVTAAEVMATAAPAPAKTMAPPAPAAPTSLKREAPKPVATETTPPAPEAAPAEAAKPAAATPQSVAVAAPAPAPAPTPAATPAKPAMPAKPEPISGAPLKLSLEVINGKPTLIFPWQERVAAAVWPRGSTIWVLFNKPATIEGMAPIVQSSSSWLLGSKQIGLKDTTLLRLETSAPLFPIATKDPEGYGWKISVTAAPTAPANLVKPDFNTTVKEPFLFLPLTEIDGPFSMQDPDIGDQLDVIPIYAASTGMNPGRSFADLSLLETAQGVVIAPNADQVEIIRLRNGLRIAAPGGLFLSPDLPGVSAPKAARPVEGSEKFKDTYYPYAKWQAEKKEGLDKTQEYLLHEIINAPSLLKKNQWRKKLAELYLSESMKTETMGVINVIRDSDPEFHRSEKLAALEGAVNLLSYHIPEAAMSFASTALDGDPEAELLRKAAAAALSDDAAPVPYMEFNDAYIRQYPPELRQRLAIIAANHAIRKQDYITPLKIFESLEQDHMLAGIEDYVSFLRASIEAEVGREKDAEANWKALAGKTEDRQFRARAQYALTLLQLREGKISPQEAIRQLDMLRIVWRGDDLEMSILNLLGQLNVNLGNYWDGLKAWEELLQYYPNSPEAIAAYGKMSETFRDLFLNGASKDMQPLQALALYDEFKELTPLGDEGNRMVQNLVDTLVKVDLLDQAAARLQNQVEFRLQGQEKSVIGARLALIHLLNREPAQALSALQATRVENVPASLSLERNRLAAKALLEFKKPEQALSMIEGDYSPEGEAVRLEAYWAQNDWANVIDMVELAIARRPDQNAPFTPKEGQHLLQLAMSYVFLGEFNQMAYLRNAYGPLMKDNPYEDEFNFLTQDHVPVDHKDFQQVAKTISSIESFMGTFRDKLKKSELSDAIAAPAANEPAAEAAQAEKPIPDVGQAEAAKDEKAAAAAAKPTPTDQPEAPPAPAQLESVAPGDKPAPTQDEE